ncbi:A/G-specific adenine glycosylase [Ruminococcaceae bacterium OttesenSCG-928-O06]|nr:A/G-specific adenine glycosylase [Ruminococcaceae bacterium OttesenSCG-928-O06]
MQNKPPKNTQKYTLPPGALAPPLLRWYHKNRRVLPFREDATPYHVWVSEIMLQQTRMAAAVPFYQRFIAALPDVAALAACSEEKLHKLWEGLGYYSRVRNMQKAAQAMMQHHGGALPGTYEALLALPGIGPYTAGAIASIAFGQPYPAVDGNVLRVMARLTACPEEVEAPTAKSALVSLVQHQMPKDAPGAYNQALMELGALVCTPRTPACMGPAGPAACPVHPLCEGLRQGIAATLPKKVPKKPRKTVPVCVLAARDGTRVLLQRRAETGLLAGLWQPVLWEARLTKATAAAAIAALVPGATLGAPLPKARHIFTHITWEMYGWQCTLPAGAAAPSGPYALATPQQLLQHYTLPGAFRAYLPMLLGEGNLPQNV